ncbi:MAG TPA: FKBP-type peptidyl-prolyl cis-trans isomerase [Caulobacteraceae bacterium]|nr:FKBP-type peptidyl-prolyl cis-trans isomerase [Caulobacteraceae bacterium]
MRSKPLEAAAAFAALALLAACGRPGADKPAQPSPEAAAFLAKNAKAEGVKTLPSGLQYKVIRSGPANAPRPDLNDEVKVHYEGALIDGTVFDSSYEGGSPAIFTLDGLIPAWEQAIPQMRVGDAWYLYVPPELGYGPEGAGPIPPNSVLVFKIELLGVLPKAGTGLA